MKKKFIKATKEYTTLECGVPVPLMRRSFTLHGEIKSAEIFIAGLGLYKLFVNGVEITKGYLAPYISNPDDIIYYDSYSCADCLREGENVIGVMLGNGFLNCPGGKVWNFDKVDYRDAPKLAIEVKIEAGDEIISFDADEAFLTHPSALLLDDLRLGETYDASLEIDGWAEPGLDTAGWTPAIYAEPPRGEMRLCEAEPIVARDEIKAVKIFPEDGAFIYDFGVNTAGVWRLKIKGDKGQKIVLWHGEQLTKDGKFENRNIRFYGEGREFYSEYNQTYRITCSGGEDVYVPHFSYIGYRYVKVEGLKPEQATEELLTYIPLQGDFATIGGFSCSDERLNKLFGMVDIANRSNLLYFPTDCPHREKNGWTGDASMSADQMILQYDLEPMWLEWLRNIRKAQNDRGELPGIVPTGGWGFAWGNGPTWDSVLFNLPYMLYKYRGSTTAARECAHAMVRYLEYAMTRRSEDGTIAIGLGDWVPVNKSADAYDAPLALTDSVMVMDMARKACEMLSAIGYTHQAAFADGIYRDMRETVRRELVDLDTMLVKGDCQSSQAIALYYGVFEPCESRRAFSHLKRQIEQKRGAFDCGFIGMHCIFHVLSIFDESELAMSMITRPEFPSYTRLIDEGVTALPEQFLIYDEYYPNSLNHHFLGDVSRWLMTRLAGLKVIDHKTVEIDPQTVAGIDYAEAYYMLPAGEVRVRWERLDNGEINVEYTAPEGVTVL